MALQLESTLTCPVCSHKTTESLPTDRCQFFYRCEVCASILALDATSGLDAGTGTVHTPTIRAAATMTLALPKLGLRVSEAKPFIGELYLANIGVPRELYAEPSLGLQVPSIFTRDEIVRL
jgi:NAD(P)H-hydrate epimerase